MSDLSTQAEIELAALADGTLAGDRREAVSERVGSSPELTRELELQKSALRLLGGAETNAPESLHLKVSELIASPPRRPVRGRAGHMPRWPSLTGAGLALGACAAVLAVVLGGGGSAPQLSQAFALTLRPATVPAPKESQSNRSQLTVGVEGVSFPYWRERFGWRTSGARMDHFGGHPVTTVFYADRQGQRVGYAILAGPPPPAKGGRVVWHHGVRYRVLSNGGVPVVTWMRAGHACVISGRGLSSRTLLKLASWSDLGPSSQGEST